MDSDRVYKVIILAVIAFAIAFIGVILARSIDEPLWRLLNPEIAEPQDVYLEVPAPEPVEISFIFGGDVMLSRQVGQRMVKYDDYDWPFRPIASLMQAADVAVVNLESPFIYDQDYFVPTGSFTFRADPQAIAGIKSAGIDVVSLANNHFANAGRQGMLDTFSILDENDIAYIGAGENESIAREGVKKEVLGHRFAFLAYAYPQDSSLADEDTAGISGMDEEAAAADVARLVSEGYTVIVSMHAGIEYTREPNWQQQEFSHAMIDAGASLIIGHHPHWPQTTEIYKGKLIVYSLGNLVFDQMWSLETQQGMLAKVIWKEDAGFYESVFLPVKIEDYGQANLMPDGQEKESLFTALKLPADGHLLIPAD